MKDWGIVAWMAVGFSMGFIVATHFVDWVNRRWLVEKGHAEYYLDGNRKRWRLKPVLPDEEGRA